MCKKNPNNSVCQTKYVKQFITSPGLVRYLIILIFLYQMNRNHNNGTMVIIITWSIVDCRLEPLSGQTKDYKTDIFCFFAKYAVLRSKSKYCLARNQESSGVKYLPVEISNQESSVKYLPVEISNQACSSITKWTLSSPYRNATYSCHHIAEKLLCSWC